MARCISRSALFFWNVNRRNPKKFPPLGNILAVAELTTQVHASRVSAEGGAVKHRRTGIFFASVVVGAGLQRR